MNLGFSIKRIRLESLTELQHISRITFEESFAAFNQAKDMQLYFENAFSLEQLTLEIQSEHSEFYFAYQEETLTGYLKINLHSDALRPNEKYGLEIERIYVKHSFQGKHIGQHILDKAINRAHELGFIQVWLGVWEHNHRAISFYRRNGFIPFGSQYFVLGTDRQTDILMRLKFSN
jgi:GNAT superfamily N-acetyltransferase